MSRTTGSATCSNAAAMTYVPAVRGRRGARDRDRAPVPAQGRRGDREPADHAAARPAPLDAGHVARLVPTRPRIFRSVLAVAQEEAGWLREAAGAAPESPVSGPLA